MDRHDTHLLSEESELKEKEEDAHQFNFNESIYLSYDSEDRLVSKESVNNSPLHLNYIEQNNIENNNNNNNNISIISSKEIRDIFHGQEKSNKKKKKLKKNKYFIKLRKIKLNNDDSNEIVENCLTYFPTLRNDIIDKKINKHIDKNRNCVSLNNKNKNKNNKNRIKLMHHKKLNSFNEKEVLYFFYNDDNKGNQNLRNMLNIINKQKIKLLRITNNFFSIKNKEKIGTKVKNKYPLINTKNKTNKKITNSTDNVKSNKLKKNNKDNSNYRKINSNLNQNKNKQRLILKKNNTNSNNNHSNNNNSNYSSNNMKFLVNTNYSNKNTSKSKIRKSSNQSTSLISTKNNEKVGMLYNQLYGYGKKKQRVKSTESLFENRPNGVWQNIHDYKDQTFLNVYKKNKKENRIKTKKLFCSQNGSLINHFSRHFGNNKNCPVCQANKHKQDESIREKGICPMIPNIGDDDSQSRLQNRRVYSALSRVLSKMNRNHNEFDFLKNNLNGSKTKNRNLNRSKINGLNHENKMFKIYFNGVNNRMNLKRSESAVVRKVKVDRNLFKENNSSN